MEKQHGAMYLPMLGVSKSNEIQSIGRLLRKTQENINDERKTLKFCIGKNLPPIEIQYVHPIIYTLVNWIKKNFFLRCTPQGRSQSLSILNYYNSSVMNTSESNAISLLAINYIYWCDMIISLIKNWKSWLLWPIYLLLIFIKVKIIESIYTNVCFSVIWQYSRCHRISIFSVHRFFTQELIWH